MENILLSKDSHLRIEQMNILSANVPFYHVERIARTYVLIYVLSGCIYVSEEDDDYEIQKGELLILRKGTHQFGKHEIEAGTSWIYAHFLIDDVSFCATEKDGVKKADPENDGAKKGSPEKDGDKKEAGPENDGAEYLSAKNDADSILLPQYINLQGQKDIERRLMKLCEIGESGRAMCMSRVAIGLWELLLDIYEFENEQKNTGGSEKLISRIKRYAEDNVTLDIRSIDLENEFHLSYKYMNRIFKRTTGKSIMQYHGDLRMEAAVRELRTTNKSISLIGNELGFEDPLYFSKCFRRYMDVSPREYRKEILKKF